MNRIFSMIALFLAWHLPLLAQNTVAPGNKWDLRRCVEYAMANNIQARQADITAKNTALTLEQSQLSRWGQVSGSFNNGMNFGRSINPNTNLFTNISQVYSTVGLQGGLNLFNFGNTRNTIASNESTLEADKAAAQKIRNDIGLNVANTYLRALLNFEQIRVNEVQCQQTLQQLTNTRKLVSAGTLPELNAAELDAQLARDSAAYYNSQVTAELTVLELKGLLNLPADMPFELDTPPVERIPVDNILEVSPDALFQTATGTLPEIRGSKLRLDAAEKAYKATKAQQYPSLSLFANLNSQFVNQFEKPSGFKLTGFDPSSSYVEPVPGTQYPVYNPRGEVLYSGTEVGDIYKGYWGDLNDNFRQSVGLGLQIPIFNGGQARIAKERAKLNIESQKMSVEQESLSLKQDIFSAYNAAYGAFQLYNANQKSLATAQRSFDLATKRYDAGVLQTIEWLTIQNNLYRAKVQALISQYDYVFKMKLLEFYKGQGIRLQ